MFLNCPLYTCGISIVLLIQSLDPRWGLDVRRFRCIYTPAAPPGLLEAGAQCAPYRCTFQTGSEIKRLNKERDRDLDSEVDRVPIAITIEISSESRSRF